MDLVNSEMAAKLESELSMEKDMRDGDSFPEHLKEYLDNSPFKVSMANTSLQEFSDEQISCMRHVVKKK